MGGADAWVEFASCKRPRGNPHGRKFCASFVLQATNATKAWELGCDRVGSLDSHLITLRSLGQANLIHSSSPSSYDYSMRAERFIFHYSLCLSSVEKDF